MTLMLWRWAWNDLSGEYSNPWSTWGMVHTVRYPSSSAATKYFKLFEYPPVMSRVMAGGRWKLFIRVGRVRMSCTQCRFEIPGSWQRCISFRSQISYLERINTLDNYHCGLYTIINVYNKIEQYLTLASEVPTMTCLKDWVSAVKERWPTLIFKNDL